MLRVKSSKRLLLRKSNGTFSRAKEAELLALRGNNKIADLARLADNIEDISVGYGFKPGIHQPSGLTYAFLASILENGTADGHIPPRPYLRLSAEIISQRIDRQVRNKLLSLINDSLPVRKTRIASEFGEVADYAAFEVKRVIRQRAVKVLDNSISTLSQKEGSRPWIDSGELISKIEGFIRVA